MREQPGIAIEMDTLGHETIPSRHSGKTMKKVELKRLIQGAETGGVKHLRTMLRARPLDSRADAAVMTTVPRGRRVTSDLKYRALEDPVHEQNSASAHTLRHTMVFTFVIEVRSHTAQPHHHVQTHAFHSKGTQHCATHKLLHEHGEREMAAPACGTYKYPDIAHQQPFTYLISLINSCASEQFTKVHSEVVHAI